MRISDWSSDVCSSDLRGPLSELKVDTCLGIDVVDEGFDCSLIEGRLRALPLSWFMYSSSDIFGFTPLSDLPATGVVNLFAAVAFVACLLGEMLGLAAENGDDCAAA